MTALMMLKEVEEMFVVNLIQYVQQMQRKYPQAFQPIVPGIYLLNKTEPVMVPNRVYYSESSYKTHTPIQALDNINEAILDEDGQVIIPAYIVRNQKKFLSTAPNLPVQAIQVAVKILNEYIDSLLPYTEPQDYRELVKPYLTEEGLELYDQGKLEGSLSRLINEVGMFINVDIWNIYFINVKNIDLYLTKSVDYRVYDWTRRKENEDYERRIAEEEKQNT